MISFEEAYQIVLSKTHDFGNVTVPLAKADGRILAENVFADRDFPPFDRATKDGIAIRFDQEMPLDTFAIEGVAAAGSPQKELQSASGCYEIMTGAVLPKNTDTVVMYEHLDIRDGSAKIVKPVTKGQNIHYRGSDEAQGAVVLSEGTLVTAAEIGVLASIGKAELLVKKNPRITLFSTGDELVPVNQVPKPHQIRQSNSHTLRAALFENGIASEIIHIKDDRAKIEKALLSALENSEVLLVSGGVSKGKYDYLPEVLEGIGVQKRFHRVLQRPGKPFWFGEHTDSNTTIFGFPGNPTSTFANFHIYFKPWLNKCLGQANAEIQVFLEESFENTTDLMRFIRAKAYIKEGKMRGNLIDGNGSGDLTSLTKANGFIKVKPGQTIENNEKVGFIPTRKII
ncbi:molybdopterin molybdotransferase MoeA [Muricauda sp. SCSIO 64092]|uniref:molybdopterin molybdotransferase MoeA n=1 Tax=Allomuricauda sp. SCSIO 64092 TaxID=2908842 RepID=UPI001FF501A4|nr:molybdopterin molybdotransferase MoeA [Muricauda sp. SCSIO 64092]UOY06628.1 molybdopterin molybdotransferase MoeA [Muricauda sp. SCSIO 64092]